MRKLALCLALLPLPVMSQTDDRSYLTAFLEDNLSGAGRKVVVTGFEGALSSQAKISELTIADEGGVWLTLRDVVLDWNRAALLSGNVSVNQLSAGQIVLARLPQVPDNSTSPEATAFALPELPVSVTIGRLAAEEIVLAPEILGQAVVGQLEAALSLTGGEGEAALHLMRKDSGPTGNIDLTASYSNSRQSLAIDLQADEGGKGIAATLLGLPGAPAASLSIRGEGPFSDFLAQIALATDGVDRLSGEVAVTATSENATGFRADLTGDLAPLFLPEYAAFFGNAITLQVQGERQTDGRMTLPTFAVQARAIDLKGQLSLQSDGQPQGFDLTGRIALPDGSPVLLPLTTDSPVRVQSADIALRYDRSKGEGWTASAAILGYDQPEFRASSLSLTGSGRIGPQSVGATLQFTAEGLDPSDSGLAQALGSVVTGDAVAFWAKESGQLSVPELHIQGQDYAARITGLQMQGLADGLPLQGKLTANLDDLSRLSGLVGRPLSGAASLELGGALVPLSGAFDLQLTADGTDMAIGIAEVDNLLRGTAKLTASAQRDGTGISLKSLTVTANRLNAFASGQLASTASDLLAQFELPDLSVLGTGYGGQLSGEARLTGGVENGSIRLIANGSSLHIGQPEADKLLVGNSQLTADMSLTGAGVRINRAELHNPQLDAVVNGAVTGAQRDLDISAQLKNLGLLLPELPGAVTVKGTLQQNDMGALLNLTGKGPGGIDATVSGKLATDFSSGDLTIRGRAQAALANAFIAPRAVSGDLGFDLRLNGPLAAKSLSGSVNLTGGRLADPALTFALENMSVQADLAGGQAKLSATLPVSSGGKLALAGTIGLAEPFASAIGIAVSSVALRDPELYETVLNGELKVIGPLAGGAAISGRLVLGATELRVPATGFGGAGGLPGLEHRNEPADVHATRQRAGLIAEGGATSAGGGPAYGLDVVIGAPNQLFIRGRGLDAELGGELHLRGSTANVQPAGAFNLIRGRLDILGKRLDLDEALLQLEGEMVPFLRVVASTENDGITSGVLIEGPANDPKVSFTSSPELPEEEVLAQLLFGQELQNLSALQALQLANAVATLAGKGGEGVVGRLRQGFGLDNLDVKTTADGGAEVTAGKYLTKNVYSEVTVDQNGQSQINLNLDVTKSITLRGRAGSDGETGLGVFLEKDY